MRYGLQKDIIKLANSAEPPRTEDYAKGVATIGGAATSGAAMTRFLPVGSDFAKKHPVLRGALYAGGLSTGGLGTRAAVDAYRNEKYKQSLDKAAADMPPFLSQDRPEKVKEIYRALKREHPEYSAGKKARIANAMGKEAEIEYRGKKFPGYNQPIDSDRPEKKKMVLAKKGDQVKLIHFGQKGYKHNYSDAAKKNYLTRSAGIRGKDGSLTANDKFSANYWARRELWPKNEPADGSARSQEKRASDDTKKDERKVTPLRAVGTLLGINAGLNLASLTGTATAHLMPGGVRDLLDPTKRTPEAEREFADLLKKSPVTVRTGNARFEDAVAIVEKSPILRRLPPQTRETMAKQIYNSLQNAGPHYNPDANKVVMSHIRNADVLAHELGHATGGIGKKLLQGAMVPGRLAAKPLSLGALIQGGRSTQAKGQEAEQQLAQARNLGIASAAAEWAPTLLEEARATARATMAAGSGRRWKRLRALLPAYGTYVAGAVPSAALPLTAEILRRRAQGQNNAGEKRASDDDFGRKAELAGLAVLAAPAAAHLGAKVPGVRVAAKPVSQFLYDNPSVEHALELGGLGIHAAPSLKHYMNKRKQAKNE